MSVFRFGEMNLLNLLLIPVCCLIAVASTNQGAASESAQRARRLIEQNKFEQALAVLNAEEIRDAHEPDLVYLRGYVLYRLNRIREAKSELETALELDPSSLRPRYVLGRIAESEGQAGDAIRWLEPCAAAKPSIEDSLSRIGKLYWQTGQVEKASIFTEQALLATPWDGGLHYRMARIYQQQGKSDLARVEFERTVKAKAGDAEGVQKLMECSQALSDHDVNTALRIRDEFLNKPLADPDLLVALGTSFASSGAPDAAVGLFEEASRRDPNEFPAHFNLGLALLNTQHPDQAIAPLEASLHLAPASKEGNAALALAYAMQGKFKEAIGPLEVARQADPNDSKTAGLLSLAYYRSGEPIKAVPILRESIRASKGDPKFFFLLIECLNATENQAEALTVAQTAVERFPKVAQAWLAEAQQLARLGRYHEAGPSFAKAAELAPERTEPLLGLAEAQQKDGNYEAALETYRKAADKDQDVTAVLGAARSLIYLNRAPEARTLLEHCADQNVSNSQVHFELSRVYARLGEKKLAEEQTRIVQQLRTQGSKPDRTGDAVK